MRSPATRDAATHDAPPRWTTPSPAAQRRELLHLHNRHPAAARQRQHRVGCLVRDAGLAWSGHPRPPRCHDLRHSFAVNTLIRWYRQGLDVEQRLPLLSTYLGHVAPKSTYWYLSAVPELLELIADRLDAMTGVEP